VGIRPWRPPEVYRRAILWDASGRHSFEDFQVYFLPRPETAGAVLTVQQCEDSGPRPETAGAALLA
jgi:hypothetical protein